MKPLEMSNKELIESLLEASEKECYANNTADRYKHLKWKEVLEKEALRRMK